MRCESAAYWEYGIAFSQEGKFPRQGSPLVKRETVSKNGHLILKRPTADDRNDERLLSQTYLEQISANQKFRELADYFEKISYLHLVPQMIRNNTGTLNEAALPAMYGGRFLENIARTPKRTQEKYLKVIQQALQIAVPQLKELKFTKDEGGKPHLEARYEHWRPKAGIQNESQFSDGTLRLIGFLWALQDATGLLLMEEPELSLHQGIVRQLASFIYRAQTRAKGGTRQAFISTHSVDLLSDPGISAEEILLFQPSSNDRQVAVF